MLEIQKNQLPSRANIKRVNVLSHGFFGVFIEIAASRENPERMSLSLWFLLSVIFFIRIGFQWSR